MDQPNLIYSTGPTQSNPGVQDQMGPGDGAMVPQNGGNNNPNMGARQRLQWTNELHDRFVEAVTQLGGQDSTRQLQLRIEAQGKYLQKIIEEQQRITGAGASRATSSEQLPDSKRTYPPTPVLTSESPLQAVPFSKDKGKRVEPIESASHDDLPHGEPQTPDSNSWPGSPTLSPRHERPAKRQRGSSDGTPVADGDFALAHIFESSTGPELQQCSMPYSSH